MSQTTGTVPRARVAWVRSLLLKPAPEGAAGGAGLVSLRPWAEYLGAAALSVLILVVVLRLWRADLTVPFAYSGDGLLTCAWVKGLVEHGWFLHNPSVGLPSGLDVHDFPMAESLHFAVIKLLSLAVS